MSKPVALETTAAQNYQILWKEDFLNHMRDSPYFLTPKVAIKANSTLRYSDQWANAIENSKIKAKPEFNWAFMPNELQANINRRRRLGVGSASGGDRKAKSDNIEDRLKVLEEKERKEGDPDVLVKATSDSEHEVEEEDVAADEEMDDENDYGNSYFDNGESYNEEDDNLDDGPVY